jgi:drug/metabolite transporter (DMT)-like permease
MTDDSSPVSPVSSPVPAATGQRRLAFIALGAFANCLWGAYAPLSRTLQTRDAHLPPISLVIVLSGMAALCFFTWFLGIRRIGFAWLRNKTLWLMASIVLVRALSNISATGLTTPVNNQLIGLLAPFIVALLSRFWLKDKLPPFTWLSMLLSLSGTLLVLLAGTIKVNAPAPAVGSEWWRDAAGIGLQILSTSSYASYIVMVKLHRGLSEGPLIVSQSLLVFLVGPLVSAGLQEDWTAWAQLDGRDIALICFFGFGIFTVGAASQIWAISQLSSAALVAVFLPLRLVVTLLLSMLLLDESIEGPLQIVGTVIVLLTLAAYLIVNRSVASGELAEKRVKRVFLRCLRCVRVRTPESESNEQLIEMDG